MQVNVLSLFPEMVTQALSYGVIGRAIEKNMIQLNAVNPRDYAENKHNRVDDKPFGGGPGMVMMYDPLARALASLPDAGQVVCLSPHGQLLTQAWCNEMAQGGSFTLVCGRYEGIDQRFIDNHVDHEVSIGDYVISGGELAACVLVDAIGRQIKDVLGDDESAGSDSFMQGMLGVPQYTRSEILGQSGVPAVLLSGHHGDIEAWRKQAALKLTTQRRPDLLEGTSEG